MATKDIKVGETYNVRVKVRRTNTAGVYCYACDKDGAYLGKHPNLFTEDEAEAFSPVTSAPKYDPCRFFRKGDKVRIKTVNERDFNSLAEDHKGKILTVLKDEEKHCNIFVEAPISDDFFVNPAYLELVTPVEEMERYVIIHNALEKFFDVAWKDDDETDGLTGRTRCRATYWYNIPPQTYTQTEAKAAAEAECDRLNAEYRKEMS